MSKFKNIINNEMQNIQLSDDIKMSVLNSTVLKSKKRFNFKPLVIAVASLCTASMLTIGVGAVAFGGFNEFINGVSLMFEPVNQVDTYDGLKLTVQSAGVEDKLMCVYFTLEDTSNLDRVTENTSVFPQVKLENQNNDNECTYWDSFDMISFDEDTHIATYKLVASTDWWHTFTKKNTFSISDFIFYENSTTYSPNINLYELAKDNLNAEYEIFEGMNYTKFSDSYSCYASHKSKYKCLIPLDEPIPVDENISITNIGFINGHLHLKLRTSFANDTIDGNHDIHKYIGDIKLISNDGTVFSNNDYQGTIQSIEKDYTDIEICFKKVNDISKLEGLKLSYTFNCMDNLNTYDEYGKSQLSVTFKLSDDIPQE